MSYIDNLDDNTHMFPEIENNTRYPSLMGTVDIVVEQFILEFVAHPYHCYTEHGIHALFYTMLYHAIPAELRYTQFHGNEVCVIQKEYPTANNLGKPQRQHWDIAIVKTPPSSIYEDKSFSYDFLRLSTVIEFGLNEAKDHLVDDIERLKHPQANLDLGIIIHLYRLSSPSKKISNRDWSSKSPRIMEIEEVRNLSQNKSIDIYYGMYDGTGTFENGAWKINNGEITKMG